MPILLADTEILRISSSYAAVGLVGDYGAADAAASVSSESTDNAVKMNGGLYQHLPSLVGIVGAGQMGAGDETGFFLEPRSRRIFLFMELI